MPKLVHTLSALCLACLLAASIPALGIAPADTSATAGHKYVYLTFDDGPLPGSENIDSVVLAERIKINVFVVGLLMETSASMRRYFALYRSNPFVDIYNHSYTHAYDNYVDYYKNPQGVLADIVKNETTYNLPYKIVRLPGGNNWRIGTRKWDVSKTSMAAADLLAANGYKVFGWDVEWEHDSQTGYPIQSVQEMLKQIDERFARGHMFTPNHLVVLIHDEMFREQWEESQLKQLIDTLKTQDYLFEHLRYYPTP